MTDVFEGRTIEGDINRYTSGPGAQDDPALFLAALDELLDTPGIEAVRWNQYTPYFNDGEACEFSIYSAYVKVAGDEDGVGDYGDGFRDAYDFYNGYGDNREFVTVAGYPGKMIYDALIAFERVLENGSHFVILNEKFGDPARVTATKSGFEVEFYEHD